MVAVVIAMAASYVVTRHVPMMAIVHRDRRHRVRHPDAGAARRDLHQDEADHRPMRCSRAVLGGGLLFGRSFIAIMFDQMFNLTPRGWRTLTLRWACWFFAMAALNESSGATQSTGLLVNFKVFGMVPLTCCSRSRRCRWQALSLEPATRNRARRKRAT